MKLLTLLFTLSISVAATAQNWELFPLDQKMYFAEDGPSNTKLVDFYLMDSVLVNFQDTILYFRKNMNLQGAGSCYNEVASYIDSLGWYGPNIYALDYLVQNNNGIFYYWENSANPFYFLPNATIGESWDIVSTFDENDYSTITITYSSIAVESFLGITDSVKTYTLQANGSSPNQTPIDNFVIKLSKNHGLIEFVPFVQFLYHPDSEDFKSLKLHGMEKGGLKYGFEQPKFEDYFHLSAGDILLWHHYSKHVSGMYIQNLYSRDSITQTIKTPDSVTYIYDRIHRNNEGDTLFQPEKSVTYYKHNLQNVIEIPPNNYGFGNNQFGEAYGGDLSEQIWKSEYLTINTDTIAGDTVIAYSFDAPSFSVDTADCGIYIYWDLDYNFKLNTYSGITKYCANSWGTNCTTLIGSIIDGEQNGNMDFPTATFEIEDVKPLEIHPNPAYNLLTISNLEHPKELSYKIISSTGLMVKSGILNSKEIQIESLVPGIYFVLISSEENYFRGMFVKL